MLGTTHWSAGVRSMGSAQEKNPRFGWRRQGSARGVACLRRDGEGEGLHHREGVVHHDGDVEGRATPAVAPGQHVRDARAEEADEVDVAEPGGGLEEGECVVSCDRAIVRVNARLGLVDEDDRAGELGGWSSRGARGGCCRGEASDVLDGATADDGVVRALLSLRVVKSSVLTSVLSCKRLDEDLKEDTAQLEAVGAERWFVAEDDVKDGLD